jgi:succinate dehydrogenase / fumarate reductase flavoprotein subunit
MWEYCGMSRSEEGLKKGLQMIRDLQEEYYSDVFVPGNKDEYNPELEKALRVADFMEQGEVMMLDALNRDESCGGHFREEYQTPEGEALRRDEEFTYVAAWEYPGRGQEPILHKEDLVFENVELKTRSYK